MSGISTHVLNTALGKPAAGVPVTLERAAAEWTVCAQAFTDPDGRCRDLLVPDQVTAGRYRLLFNTAPYFAHLEQDTLYPEISITFEVASDGASYHIPLLLSPFGYTTYRGT